MSAFAVNTLLLVAVGMALELMFTAVVDHLKKPDWRLMGYTTAWMAPIYALIYPLFLLVFPLLAAWPWALRGAFYVLVIYAVEFASGSLLRALTGECPWEREYLKSRWHVRGLIRLDFAPAWFGAGLVFESVCRYLSGL